MMQGIYPDMSEVIPTEELKNLVEAGYKPYISLKDPKTGRYIRQFPAKLLEPSLFGRIQNHMESHKNIYIAAGVLSLSIPCAVFIRKWYLKRKTKNAVINYNRCYTTYILNVLEMKDVRMAIIDLSKAIYRLQNAGIDVYIENKHINYAYEYTLRLANVNHFCFKQLKTPEEIGNNISSMAYYIGKQQKIFAKLPGAL